jgi:hypothetical protein
MLLGQPGEDKGIGLGWWRSEKKKMILGSPFMICQGIQERFK